MATSTATSRATSRSPWQHIKGSFLASIGDIVFGMEDGTVSIFGLVFGLAASANSDKSVLLAGATGAVAAAVSMMAGAYLDVSSRRSIAEAKIAHEKAEYQRNPGQEDKEAAGWLRAAGFNQQEIHDVIQALKQHPAAMLKFQIARELHIGNTASENPYAHALWMFIADLVAAFTPVIPFLLVPLATARIISVTVTAILLLIVGVGRGIVSHRNVILTALETLAIAAAAAIAGVLISMLIKHVAG